MKNNKEIEDIKRKIKLNKIPICVLRLAMGLGIFSEINLVWDMIKLSDLSILATCAAMAFYTGISKYCLDITLKENEEYEERLASLADDELKESISKTITNTLDSAKQEKDLTLEPEETIIEQLDAQYSVSEYLANLNSFSDKDVVLLELMNYLNLRLNNENYGEITVSFAECFWATVKKMESQDDVISIAHQVYPIFMPTIIYYGENILEEQDNTAKEQYKIEIEEYHQGESSDEIKYLISLINGVRSNLKRIRD